MLPTLSSYTESGHSTQLSCTSTGFSSPAWAATAATWRVWFDLHATDRDEGVAALGERVGDEVLQLALVPAVGDTGVAVLPLGPQGGTTEVLRQALQRMHGRGPEEQG